MRNTRRTMAILKRSVLSWLTAEIKRVADGATFHRIPFMNNTKHETVISLLSFRGRRLWRPLLYSLNSANSWNIRFLRSQKSEIDDRWWPKRSISTRFHLHRSFKIYLSLYLISYLISFIYMFTLIKRNWILSNILLFFKTRWNIWRFLWRLFFG